MQCGWTIIDLYQRWKYQLPTMLSQKAISRRGENRYRSFALFHTRSINLIDCIVFIVLRCGYGINNLKSLLIQVSPAKVNWYYENFQTILMSTRELLSWNSPTIIVYVDLLIYEIIWSVAILYYNSEMNNRLPVKSWN